MILFDIGYPEKIKFISGKLNLLKKDLFNRF
jgi:hypothetical protein